MWRFVAAAAVAASVANGEDNWSIVKEGADSWAKMGWNTHFTINIGDSVNGSRMTHNVGATRMDTLMNVASTSKWPSAATISAVVNAGLMSYDDKPSMYLPYWTTDPSDMRSQITLRHLLSFTDGYTQDASVPCETDPSHDFGDCVHQLYNAVNHSGKAPGTTWAYLECHYQFAGAMAVAATGFPIDELFKRFLFEPLKLQNTTYGNPPYKNPQLAAGMTTTGYDYAKFLRGLLDNTYLPKEITQIMETDYTAPPVTPSGMFFGHYCMGNFFECYGYSVGINKTQPHNLPEYCKEENVHSDPGLWGYYPIVDRAQKFYFQVVVKENYIKSGIPESYYMMARPLVISVMNGGDPSKMNREEVFAGGGGLIMRDLVSINEMTTIDPPAVPVPKFGGPYIPRAEPKPKLGEWHSVYEGLAAWHRQNFTRHFAFNVGNASGTAFTGERGHMTMDTLVEGASLSKWPAASMIAGVVADPSNSLTFDDTARSRLPFWTKNASDPRYGITLRQLLTFTSGYTRDVNVPCASNPAASYMDCAKDLYEATPAGKTPGTTWTYLSVHLQLAGAMASAVTGLDMDQLFKKYLYDKVGMTSTTWGKAPFKNPSLAGGIKTTGRDFEKFLKGLLTYSLLDKEVCDEMEKDYTATTSPSGDGWFGHYGMGHWFECFGYGTPNGNSAPLTQFCKDEAIQAGPGLFGYYPLIDRKRGYYMQIVVQEPEKSSGIPEYLRMMTKASVDALMAGIQPAHVNRRIMLNHGSGILLRDLVYIVNNRV